MGTFFLIFLLFYISDAQVTVEVSSFNSMGGSGFQRYVPNSLLV